MDDLILLHTASSIIERDAVLAYLRENLITAESPARDMSRKYTETTVDLSLGGYSTFFDGFKIFVQEQQHKDALKVLDKFMLEQKQEVVESEPATVSYINKFYFFGMASFFVPIVPIFFGIYFLRKGIKAKEKIKASYFIVSLFFYIGPVVAIYVLGEFLLNLGRGAGLL